MQLSVFLVGSTFVLCSCYFFGMSFSFRLAYPNLSCTFKARSKDHSDAVDSHGYHHPSSFVFDFTHLLLHIFSLLCDNILKVRKHTFLSIYIYI